jgi:hypothetical protein
MGVGAAQVAGDDAPDENGFQPILMVISIALISIVTFSVTDGDVDDLWMVFKKKSLQGSDGSTRSKDARIYNYLIA